MRSLLPLLFSVSWLAACGAPCDSAALTASLASAAPGSVVAVPPGQCSGHFVVGPGVTLRGAGPISSVLTGAGPVVELQAGATLEGVRIENAAAHGIVAVGTGSTTIRNVEVHATRGRAAIGISGATSLVIEDATLVGPVTMANATSVASRATSADTALYGLVVVGVPSVTLTRVSVSGFGAGGVVLSQSTTRWSGGTVASNLGIGVWVDGGSADITSVSIADTLRGFRLTPSYGLASGRMASVRTHGLAVTRTESGFGVFHDGGDAQHDGLMASGHAAGALLAQRTTSLSITGGSVISGNQFAGVLAVSAGTVTIADSMIASTRMATRMLGDWGTVAVGDGLQVVGPGAATTLTNVMLMDNDRAGILIDLAGGTTAGVGFRGVSIAATGSGLGCVAQHGTEVTGWDTGMTRSGTAVVNDGAFSGAIPIVGIVSPTNTPVPSAIMGIVSPSN